MFFLACGGDHNWARFKGRRELERACKVNFVTWDQAVALIRYNARDIPPGHDLVPCSPLDDNAAEHGSTDLFNADECQNESSFQA